ncbi:hypothetical protein D3C80_1140420 [compost metagenome]
MPVPVNRQNVSRADIGYFTYLYPDTLTGMLEIDRAGDCLRNLRRWKVHRGWLKIDVELFGAG